MPIVTLSTDIGQQDFVVGAIKGQLLSCNPLVNIVDISHQLPQTNYPQAAYICSNAYQYFPDFTFHIIILNFFETSSNQLLIVQNGKQYIICADNGIITMILGQKPTNMVSVPINNKHSLLDRTAVIATNIAKLIDTNDILTVGLPPSEIYEKYPLRATIGANWIDGQILFIDNFENVVVNITKSEFEEQRRGRNFFIEIKQNELIASISNNYSSAQEGEKLAWFNSAGYLEIAMNKGNIAGLFGLERYNEKQHRPSSNTQNKLFYQTIRIFFR